MASAAGLNDAMLGVDHFLPPPNPGYVINVGFQRTLTEMLVQ